MGRDTWFAELGLPGGVYRVGSPRKTPRNPQYQQAYPAISYPPPGSPRVVLKHGLRSTLWRKGWFWGVVGLLAAVIVIVVVVAVAFTTGIVGAKTPASSSNNVVLDFDMNSSGPRAPLKLSGNKLVRGDGQEVEIHGVNWFGFNNGKTMVDGLDGEPTPSWEGGDFATIVQTLKLLGFNAVRLPFQFTDLLDKAPMSFDKSCPGTPPTAASLAARTTAPGVATNGKAVPSMPPAPPGSKPGVCNGYLPNGPTTLARYLWVVQYFVNNGYYVLVDYHSHLSEPALQSPASFAQAWLRVWKPLTALPTWNTVLKGRVFLDVMNEPDEHQLGWDKPFPGSQYTAALSDYYFAAMDALYQDSPDSTLFFIQGGGQSALGTSWGDGFATNKTWIQQRGLSDANGFFNTLLSKPYRDRVVLAPHLYGVSVTHSPDVGMTEFEKFEVSWGTLQKNGYCNPANPKDCQTFPVVAGEIGTNFQSPVDTQYYNDMATFFNKQPPADAYTSAAFNNWFWWSYNANSGDTGGLVMPDWQTLNWQKLTWLQDKLRLKSWYLM